MALTSMAHPWPDWLKQPLILEPYLRPMPWGGERLAEWLGLPKPDGFIGEAWLVSDHHLHSSRIVNAPDRTYTLRTIMANWPEVAAGYKASKFPLLVKLIEARENLSIQVHPDDEAARQWAPKEGGKTEAWLVLDATPQAKIYLGLRSGITRDVLQRELPLGTLPLCLNVYTPKVGECYYVPAGTVHALGGGVCVLEVQQTSDATFRLYDWGRLDAQGKPRPLHIEAALSVLREQTPDAGPRTPNRIAPDCEELMNCRYFAIYRLSVSGQKMIRAPCILICLTSTIAFLVHGMRVELPRGYATLLPALLDEANLVCAKPSCVIMITWPRPLDSRESA